MIDEMDDADLGRFAADVCREAGLTAHLWEQESQVFVGVEHQGGEYRRALLWAVTGDDRQVTAESVGAFADLCDREGVADASVLAACPVTDDGRRAAAERGIGVVDREGLRAQVEEPAVSGLLGQGDASRRQEAVARQAQQRRRQAQQRQQAQRQQVQQRQQAQGGRQPGRRQGQADGRQGAQDGSADRVERLRAFVSEYRQLGALALVGLLVLVAAILGLAILGLLPGGGGGMAVDANSSIGGQATDVIVAWDAQVGTAADVNDTDPSVYPAPEGSRFVVVRMRVRNVGGEAVALRHSDFVVAAGGSVHGYQPLSGYDGFPDDPVPAGATRNVTTVFRVPANASSASLQAAGGLAADRGVLFERNESLVFDVTAE